MCFVIKIPGVSHVLLVLLLVLFTFFGAYLMIFFEEPWDERRKLDIYESQMVEFNHTRQYIAELEAMIKSSLDKKLDRYQIATLQWCSRLLMNSKPKLQPTVWNIWQAIFYVTSLYTTVGYGNVYPVTICGRCFTMIYAIIGIPLVILILDDWGKLLFRFVCSVWSKVSWCSKVEVEDEDETDEDDLLDIHNVPVLLALFICIGYICFCAAIYLIWEDEWTYFTSFYFFFISLTTVGLGDVIPKHIEYSVCTGILVLFGLAVVSMCLNVIEAKLDTVFKDLAKAIDHKYEQSLQNVDQDELEMSFQNGELGMRMKNIEKEQNWQKRLLYRMMNKEKKQLLKKKIDQKSKLRNIGIQAMCNTNEFGCQVQSDTVETSTQITTNHREMWTQTYSKRSESTRKTQTNEAKTSRLSRSFSPPVYRWALLEIV